MRLTRLDQITLRTGVAMRMLVKCSDMLVLSFETYHALPIAPQPQLGENKLAQNDSCSKAAR